MNIRKLLAMLLALICVVSFTVFAEATATPRIVAECEAANEGVSLTPTSYTETQVPGVPYVGAFIIGSLDNLMNLVGINVYSQDIVKGAVLLCFMCLMSLLSGKKGGSASEV